MNRGRTPAAPPFPHVTHFARLRRPLAVLTLVSIVLVGACSKDSDESGTEMESSTTPSGGSSGDGEGDGDGDRDGDGEGDGARGGGPGVSTGGGTEEGSGGLGGSSASDCDASTRRPTGEWTQEPDVDIDSSERRWSLRLPSSYDASLSYPVVFLFHGCDGETDILPLEDEVGEEAILVRGLADGSNGCWSGLSEDNELFFVEMLERVSTLGCVAPSKIFAVGYDSGADVVNRIACTHAYLIDATATVAGENTLPANPACTGPAAALLIHDEDDPVDDFSEGEEVRDRFIDQNFCVADGFPEPVDPDPCVSYSGCGEPVIWCATSGQGHSRQDSFAGAIWEFLSAK